MPFFQKIGFSRGFTVLVINMITYDELEDKLCHVMSIDHAHTVKPVKILNLKFLDKNGVKR